MNKSYEIDIERKRTEKTARNRTATQTCRAHSASNV